MRVTIVLLFLIGFVLVIDTCSGLAPAAAKKGTAPDDNDNNNNIEWRGMQVLDSISNLLPSVSEVCDIIANQTRFKNTTCACDVNTLRTKATLRCASEEVCDTTIDGGHPDSCYLPTVSGSATLTGSLEELSSSVVTRLTECVKYTQGPYDSTNCVLRTLEYKLTEENEGQGAETTITPDRACEATANEVTCNSCEICGRLNLSVLVNCDNVHAAATSRNGCNTTKRYLSSAGFASDTSDAFAGSTAFSSALVSTVLAAVGLGNFRAFVIH